jgi:LuxR family transcriptional regulator, maltose regulon positive regulatory protein
MKTTPKTRVDNRNSLSFERPRLNQLFAEAVKFPVVVVCAGAGYGKTCAVHDFAQEYQATTFWLQLSERDNTSARFWESYIHALTKLNAPLAKALTKLGFPDTKDKLNHYLTLLDDLVEKKRRIIVMDDFHCIEEPSVIRFIEECILFKMPPGTSVFLVSRTIPDIKTANGIYEKKIFNISEDDLRFTESELAQYFRSRNISVSHENLREIMRDTGGWAFAINFIAQSYKKAPGYSGYVRNALRTNIFGIIETELWNEISAPLQNFLLRLSLIDHLSVDLITQLAGNEEALVAELEKQSAYVRRDNFINAYLIHPLFLEFLTAKQNLIEEEQKKETYAISGNWCARNGFKIDAMSYYEKTEDYKSILLILASLTTQIPQDIAKYAAQILDRAPADAFDKVEFLADMHLRTYICQGLLQKSLELVKHYEEKFLKLPDEPPSLQGEGSPLADSIKNRTLTRLYICWTYIRCLMSVTDDIFDFDTYIEKACKCVHEADAGKLDIYYPGAWINFAGSSRKGSPQDFIAVITRNHEHIQKSYMKGFMAGELGLAYGELEFYRGDTSSAEPHITFAVKQARTEKQFGLMHRALLYTLRIAASQGNFILMEQTLKDTKAQLDEVEYVNRFFDYDISLSWYYCFLGQPEKAADWLKEDFLTYSHAASIDNFANQIIARLCYATRNFSPLLSYIEEMKRRESFLFGRVEMLAMEACIHYKLKDKEKAFAVFEEAYKNAEPNGILMPFIEMGKDMRTLAAALLKESRKVIPASWLEDINHKSATYAKRRSHIIAKHTQSGGGTGGIALSPREAEILNDISHGLSRAEIAVARELSINTIKMIINKIHYKLGAENLADLIRIAVEKKLI